MVANAVLYLRVASCEQAEGSRNLRNQEKRCRAYCRQMGLKVLGVFTDAGVSGFRRNGPGFRRMLIFTKEQSNSIRYVVVQELSLVSRDHRVLADVVNSLGRNGVQLRSTF